MSNEVTVHAGRNLFEAGVTIRNAERFRDMNPGSAEQYAYFAWERSCLIAYAHSLSIIDGTAGICEADVKFQGVSGRCRGTVAKIPPTGVVFGEEFKCINCGARAETLSAK